MEIETAENLSRKLRSLANGANWMTVHDWYMWLQDQERISFEEYRGRPNRLVSDFKGESQYIRDYDGREILELLQNGNDAARKAGTRARMRFELLPSGLIAANTGAPFSSPGVASLCLAHTSPKPAEGPLMIGNKGLGFRAVLNWTRFPLILSGDLAIVFSARVTQEKQAKLELLSEELRACIEREKHLSGDRVVALLAFPGFGPDGDLTHFLDDMQNAIYSRCRELRKVGYDTVIGIPFNQESVHAAARKQLRLVRPEILLFASSLAELEIVMEGEPSECWRKDEPEGVVSRVYLEPSNADYREWKLYSKRGVVPREYLPPEQPSSTEYELKLAIPTNHNAVPGYLYSYFPTEVRFPYPLVCHVTLDLISNRQQPQNTPANQFILGQLAEFMAETAETLAREISAESGLKLIAGDSSSSDGLEKFDFRSRLLNAAKTRPIVPTLNDGIVIPHKARRVAFSDTSWLPKSVFGSVVNLNDQSLRPVLEKLDVPPLCASDWLIAEGSLSFKTLEERADFIAGVIRYYVTEAYTISGLLLDGDGKPVPRGYKVFLPPTAQRGLSLPEWFEIRFLHQGLRQALTDKLQPKDQEGLAALLAPLGVTKYSLDSVLGALIAQANRSAEADLNQNDSIRRQLLQALCGLFPLSESREERARFPKDARVLVLTKAGTYEDARKLYLSAEYGTRGRILEDLYGSFAPEKLIAPPAALGVSEEASPLAEFFLWIGVAEFPRGIVVDNPDYGFHAHVKASMSEPVVMQDYSVEHVEDLPVLTFREVLSVDGLEKFLSQAPFVAVLSWLATDNRALNWKSSSVLHGKVGCWPPHRRGPRFSTGPVPSYVRWRLQTTKWLPTRNKRLAAPRECLAEPVQGIEDLLPPPARPTQEQAQRYDVPIANFRDAFDRAGVLPGFSQIDPEQLYDLLLSLPTCDKNGSVAKSVYNAVLKHFESADVRDSAARERFIRTGEILARSPMGDKYWTIDKVRHVDSEDIPTALRRRINVAALPKRSGSQKVKALFGVQTVERSEIIRRITHYQSVCDASIVNDEIQHLKPLFFHLRRSQARRTRESAEFRQFNVLVCSTIDGEVEFQGQKDPLELGSWDWILDDQSHTAYVLSDPSESELLKSALLADVVGQIFAAVFRIERGDDFARLFACQRKDRLKILKRLVGEDDVPAMEELERLYSAAAEPGDDPEVNVPPGALDRPSPPKKDVTQPEGPEEQGTRPSPPQDGDRPLQIDSIPHTPSGPPVRVECRVSRQGPAGPRTRTGSRRVTDGLFCEYKVIEFEEHDAPPRFPVRVGNITGWNAPGVDVLSFASVEDKANFLAGDHSEARITRFIEVKGRSSEGAKIDLRDNALEAARKYKDKYFLYRVFDRNDGSYALAILKNPLADETAVKVVYEVNLDATKQTEDFNIVGGCSETSYLEHLGEKQSETIP